MVSLAIVFPDVQLIQPAVDIVPVQSDAEWLFLCHKVSSVVAKGYLECAGSTSWIAPLKKSFLGAVGVRTAPL